MAGGVEGGGTGGGWVLCGYALIILAVARFNSIEDRASGSGSEYVGV